MTFQRTRPAGQSGTQNRNQGYRDWPTTYSDPTPAPIERRIDRADLFTFEGVTYDRSVLRRLMGSYPRVKASDNPDVAGVVVDAGVARYSLGNSPTERGVSQLVMVDMHLKPILAPDSYKGEPIEVVALVTKHNLKRARV